jgi:hypothetical protein
MPYIFGKGGKTFSIDKNAFLEIYVVIKKRDDLVDFLCIVYDCFADLLNKPLPDFCPYQCRFGIIS